MPERLEPRTDLPALPPEPLDVRNRPGAPPQLRQAAMQALVPVLAPVP